MIINLWSTHRTGSVWYSMHLARTFDCVRINELFNQNHFYIYNGVSCGGVRHFSTFKEGLSYYDYSLDSTGKIIKTTVFSERTRSPEEEMEHRKNIVLNMNTDVNHVVFHNHVYPLDKEVFSFLLETGNKNIYIYRKDRLAQMASYAIAYHHKRFAQFSKDNSFTYSSDIVIPSSALLGLVDRIMVWDDIPNKVNTIAYEDINFYDFEGSIHKQVNDYTKILSDASIANIKDIANKRGFTAWNKNLNY